MPRTTPLADNGDEPIQDRPDMVYSELRELIVSGRLAPGTRLVETLVARRLGVSRTPVRSAFHRLQSEGYAVAENDTDERQRLVVAPITADDADDLFFVVGELEALSGFYAAGMDREPRMRLVEELRSLNSQLLAESHARRVDAYKVFQVDAAFHRRYVVAASPPRLLGLHNATKPQADRYSRMYTAVLTDELDLSVVEHDATVCAIRDGNPDAAQSAIRVNWRNAARRISAMISEWGGSGGW
jgi:DNA-binding GntR family transcriptional regulator